MIKKLIIILATLAMFTSVANAQWTNMGAFPDSSIVGGTHGLAVDPDGKVWVASYYKDVLFGADSIATSSILVFNADGTQAAFSPISTVETGGGFVVDTLNGNCRGMGVDQDGNILYVQTGVSKISVNDFVDQLELGENYRNDFYRLRVKVLEPALKEIRGKAELPVKMKTTKTGRKVTGLEFKFPVEQQKNLSLNKPKQTARPKINNAYIEQHARPGETYEQARRRLEEEIKEAA